LGLLAQLLRLVRLLHLAWLAVASGCQTFMRPSVNIEDLLGLEIRD
jgi:hypothetical protein